MAPSQRPDNLSLQELEALVLAKRRQITERAVMRFALLERELTQRQVGAAEREGYWLKLRPPESWRGANGPARYFRGVKLTPLEAIGAKRQALPTAEIKSAGQPLPYVATVVIEDGATRQRRRWRDVLLLSVEILALVGFVAILGSSYARLRALNDQARVMQRAAIADIPTTSAPATVAPTVKATAAGLLATIAPIETVLTATLTTTPVALLPGGRPFQTSELPAPLSGLVKATVPAAAPPTIGPQTAVRLVIPKIGVDAPIIAGDSWEDLKKGVGHHPGSAEPGQVGNMVVSAHNDVYGEIFRDLDKLQSGDEVLVYTDAGAFRYIVNRVEIVAPTKVEVMDPTDYPALTMITCYPYLLDTHRVVATADLAE